MTRTCFAFALTIATLGCEPQGEDLDGQGDAQEELDYALCSRFTILSTLMPDLTEDLNASFQDVVELAGHTDTEIHAGRIRGASGNYEYCVDYSWRLDWHATRHTECFAVDPEDPSQIRGDFEDYVAAWPSADTELMPLEDVEALARECLGEEAPTYFPCRLGPPSLVVDFGFTEQIDECRVQFDTAVINLRARALTQCSSDIQPNCAYG